jgi:uncharacterized membrane protein YkvA (DUF1232 family)
MKQIELNTVKDLENYLSSRNLSPEVFAKEIKLSHMTIRRWLKKPASFPIPVKYKPIMESYLNQETGNSSSLASATAALQGFNLTELMDSVEETGRNYQDDGTLEGQLSDKLKGERFDKLMVQYVKKLFKAAVSKDTPLKTRAICVGALLYFINPIDLIPDHIPVVGYLDDFVVLSVAVNAVSNAVKEEDERKGKIGA